MLRAVVFALALMAVTFVTEAPYAQEDKSTEELRALSDTKAERQAKHDLNSLLEQFSGYKVGNRLALGDVWFFTTPRATAVPGLCARDIVSLYYHTVEQDPDNYRKAPVRPYRIEAKEMFSFIRNPTARTADTYLDREDNPLPWSRRCESRTEKGWTGWFYAENETEALQGFLALDAAAQAVEAGVIGISGCDSEQPARCRDTLDKARDPKFFGDVESINMPDGITRWRINALSSWITITVGKRVAKTLPEHVTSVEVEHYIIVT